MASVASAKLKVLEINTFLRTIEPSRLCRWRKHSLHWPAFVKNMYHKVKCGHYSTCFLLIIYIFFHFIPMVTWSFKSVVRKWKPVTKATLHKEIALCIGTLSFCQKGVCAYEIPLWKWSVLSTAIPVLDLRHWRFNFKTYLGTFQVSRDISIFFSNISILNKGPINTR